MRSMTSCGAALVAALLFGLPTAAASAEEVFTVSSEGGYGSLTAAASAATLEDTSTGAALECSESTIKGTINEGEEVSGSELAAITKTTWNNGEETCTGPLGISMSVVQEGTWYLDATSEAAAITYGAIANVDAHLEGALCTADVSGTLAEVEYNNTTHELVIDSDGLTISNVSGCLGQLANGDAGRLEASYEVTSPEGLQLGGGAGLVIRPNVAKAFPVDYGDKLAQGMTYFETFTVSTIAGAGYELSAVRLNVNGAFKIEPANTTCAAKFEVTGVKTCQITVELTPNLEPPARYVDAIEVSYTDPGGPAGAYLRTGRIEGENTT